MPPCLRLRHALNKPLRHGRVVSCAIRLAAPFLKNAIVPHVFWAPLTAFVVALATIAWLARSRISALALDHPTPRSLHGSPVPRTGGLGLHAGVLGGWLIIAPHFSPALWIGLGLVLAVSFADDLRGLPVAVRLGTHLCAAATLSAGLLFGEFGAGATLLAALAVTWLTNLYNFMDGSDGLAGGMTAIGFSFYGSAASLAGAAELAALSFSVAAAAAAFLVFNFHPARVFLGDAGSIPLGFLAAAFGLLGWLQNSWPWWFPVLVFSAFIVDASVTLARRLVRGERVWEAHRDHYYQRLVQMGWGHRRTAVAEYALMLVSGLLALATLSAAAAGQTVALIVAAAVYAAVIAWVERAWRRRTATGAAR